MTNRSIVRGTAPELSRLSWFEPHRIALITMWLITSVSLIVMLYGGVRNTGQFLAERDILQVAYVATLF